MDDLLGPDFRAGLRHPLYRPFNPAGLWLAIGIFAALLLINQIILQPAFGVSITLLAGGQITDVTQFLRGALISVLPAGLLTAWLAWTLARRRGGDPKDVLALHLPDLGLLGWPVVIGGTILGLFALFGVLSWLLGLDVNSSGLVEQAVMQLNNDPFYLLIAGGLIIGAPFAEELTFRGQLFAAIASTRIGAPGAAVITSALWSGIHITQPLPIIGLLFLMGLVFSWLLVRFGSLWVTIACHASWNAISSVTLFFMAPQ
jgi:uncharacterized protein